MGKYQKEKEMVAAYWHGVVWADHLMARNMIVVWVAFEMDANS